MTPQEAGDRRWMRRALARARRALGSTQPNPLVGAVLLDSSGRPVAGACHRRAGEPHAEAQVLEEAGPRARGGTLYVTLEPCTHQGKTPPCTDRILAAGVRRVVVACKDPNPHVLGNGAEILRKGGLDVSLGCLEEPARTLNEPFETWALRDRPLVTAKVALSMDHKIGAAGPRLILSDPACEPSTMRLRAEAGAIVVGVNSVLADDPLLTVRGRYSGRKPVRAVLDTHLRTPPAARFFSSDGGPVWLFCRREAMGTREAKALEAQGAVLKPVPVSPEERVSVSAVLEELGRAQITAVLVEGGARVFQSFAQEKRIDRWVFDLVPRVLGDHYEGRPTVAFRMRGDFPLKFRSVIRRGVDYEIVATME